MKLSRLIEGLENASLLNGAGPDPDIASIHFRAQEVTPGGAFVAIPGFKADGHDFVETALENGAAALFVQRPLETGAPCVLVKNSRKALSALAARFYGNPSEQMKVVGVTGTNGKTTITYLLEAVFQQAEIPVGVIGTVNYRWGGKIFPNPRTTPEALDLMRILSRMKNDGISHVIMEVASHAIDLNRVDHIRFDAGVFTNLTQDHLDHHGDMETYYSVKKRLFSNILFAGPKKDGARAVVHADHGWGKRLAKELSQDHGPAVIRVGFGPDCRVAARDFHTGLDGIRAKLEFPGRVMEFRSRLAGRFNLENILCAAGAAHALGISPDVTAAGLKKVTCIPGRMETIDNKRGLFVAVDYSHTPDSLENALSVLADMTPGRMICVFGCGGDRDRDKRPKMGRISATLADFSVVTSDNPRTEDPRAIIHEILKGMDGLGTVVQPGELLPDFRGRKIIVAQPDRRAAIRLALGVARKGDSVLIAGKGHETYQEVCGRMLPFDDRVEAGLVLAALDKNSGGTRKKGEAAP